MRRVFSTGVAVVAGMLSLPATVSSWQTDTRNPADFSDDSRLISLKKFFRQGNCPAEEVAHVFLDAADQNDLDWRLLPSISFIETTGGKMARNNNLFGWDSGRASFASVPAGIYQVADRLATSALYRDKSVDRILAIYNPEQGYGRKVKAVMRQISPAD